MEFLLLSFLGKLRLRKNKNSIIYKIIMTYNI